MQPALLTLGLWALVGASSWAASTDTASAVGPVERITQLLGELKGHAEEDRKKEQSSYDKFACWCEQTLGRKAGDISKGRTTNSDLSTLIEKLSGEVASHGAQIAQLETDLESNKQSQSEAVEARNSEYEAYEQSKTQSEQCIGALEAAIKVLSGAGAGKKGGFLETLQEAQLLSVVAGVRSVFRNPSAEDFVPSDGMEVVRRFIERPEDFVRTRSGVMSAAQISNNPFGDYSPQSTQIQGILKSMYDSFTADLEKSNAEEAEQQKSHEELIAAKLAEFATLQTTLERQTLDKAQKSKSLTASKTLRDDTTAQLAADERLFAETKDSCKAKASDWNERSRLFTEELHGIGEAMAILSSPEAKATFSSAGNGFMQLSAAQRRATPSVRAASHLQVLAGRRNSAGLAQLAARLKDGGHFDAVIASVDSMIEVLRAEEQADVQHRDRCQNSQNANGNSIEDLEHSLEKSDKAISRLSDSISLLQTKIESLDVDIKATQDDLDALLAMRNKQQADAANGLKDDAEAIALLDQAIQSLTKFYTKNKIEFDLLQKKQKKDPEYTVNPDTAPETLFKDEKYEGKQGETSNIVAILEMIREDYEKQMQTSRSAESKEQQKYNQDLQSMREVQSAQKATKLASEQEKADLEAKKADAEQTKNQQDGGLAAQKALEASLGKDCAWVEAHFEDRRTKRKTEIDGLGEARGYLAGVAAGTELAP